MKLSTQQLYGTNMFIIYNKLPVPVQIIFLKYMRHPIANLLSLKNNKKLNTKPFNLFNLKIIDNIKILSNYISEIELLLNLI